MNSWFQKIEKLDPAIILYVATLSVDLGYSEFSLLNYVQALEALHCRVFASKQIRLRDRIKLLLEEVWEGCLDNFVDDKETFSVKAADTRNALIHSNPRPNSKAVSGTEIFYVAERLKILLVTHLLLQLNIPKENVYRAINQFDQFTHLKCQNQQ